MDLSVQILAKYDQLEKAKEMLKALQDEYVDVCNAIKEKKLSPDTLKDVYTDIGKVGDNAVALQRQLIDLAKTFDKLSDSERKQLNVPLFSGQNSQAMNIVKGIVDKTNESYKSLLTTLGSNETIDAASSSIGKMEQSANSACSAIRQINNASSSLGDISARMASFDPSKDSAQILKYNQYINNLTKDIERNKQTLEGWNSGIAESSNASSAFADAQKILSDAIAKQQGNVDALTAQIKQLNSEYAQAKGSDILAIGAQKSGLENQLATQIGVLDKLKMKAVEVQQAYDNAASTSNAALQGLSNAMELAANSKFGSSISEQFEKVRASIVVATDSMSTINVEFRNIAINKARIDELSSAISKLDTNTQGGAIARLESEMQKCNSAIDESVAKIAKWSANTRNFDSANKSAEEAIASLNGMINVQQGCVDNLATKLASLKEAYKTATDSNKASINEEMQQVQTSLDGEQYSLNMMKATLNGVSAEWNSMKQQRENALNGSTTAYSNAINAQKTIQSETKKTTSESVAQQKAVDGLKNTWAQFLGAIGIASGLKSFISQLVEVNARMEQVKTSLYGIMESKSQADSLFNSIRDVSSHSAIGLGSLTSVAQQFVAFGESAGRIPKLLEAMNEVSMGSEQRFNRLASSLQMMAALGQVNTRTIRSMITAGFNPLLAISQKTGESMSDLMKKVKKGTIPVSEITNAFIDATQKGGMFYKMNDKMSGTLTYQFAIMKKSVAAFFLELGKQNDGTIKSITATIVNLTKHIKDFTEAAKIIVTFAGIKTAAYFASQAIIGLSTAMKVATGAAVGLNAAMTASGWGTLIALASTLGVAVYDFATSTKEATTATEKFNKAVNDSTNDVDEMFAVLNNTDKTSDVHKETLEKLVSKYKEYGINIDTSKGLLSDEVNITNELISKKETLIGLIRTEAAERAKAKQYEDYQKQRNDTYDELQSNVSNKLKGEVRNIGKDAGKTISEGVASGMSIAIIEEMKKAAPKFAKASSDLVKPDKELIKSVGAKYNDKSKEIQIGSNSYRATEKDIELLKTLKRISDITGISVEKLGLNFRTAIFFSLKDLADIDEQERDFTESVKENSDSLDANARRARYNRLSVEELGTTIRNLIENYHDNDITFHINVDDAQVPAWMKNKGWNSNGYKNMAAYYLSELNDMKKKGVKYRYFKGQDGKYHRLSQEDAANRLAQYQKQSETKKAEEDKAAAEKELKEKEEAKAQRAAEAARRKREAAQRKEEEKQRRIKEATDNYNSSIKEAVSDLSSDSEQQQNDLKEDSVEKKMRNAELTYNKAVSDADSKIENVAKSLYKLNKAKGSVAKSVEQLKKEILAANESNSEFGSLIKAYNQALKLAGLQLEKAQKDIVDELKATYDKNNNERAEKIKKLRNDIAALEKMVNKAKTMEEKEQSSKMLNNAKEQLDWLAQSKEAWNEYYQKYGTFLEKRKALEDKFLHDTQGMDEDTPEYLMLKKQYESDLKTLNFENFKKQLNWEDVFGDLGRLGKKTLEDLQAQLEAMIKNDKNLSIESIKTISDALNKIRSEQAKKGFIIGNFVGQIKETRQKKKEYDIAQKQAENVGGGYFWKRYNEADTEGKAQIREEKVYDPVTHKLTKFGDVIDRATKAQDNYVNSQKTLQGNIKAVGGSFNALASMGKDVTNMLTKFGVNVPEGVTKVFDSIGEIGSAFDGFDLTKISSFLDIQNYVHVFTGIFSGVADVFSGFFSLFGVGKGNMEEYKKALEQYNKLDKVWTSLISKKKEYLSLSYGNEAKKVGQEYVDLAKADLEATKAIANKYLGAWKKGSHSEGYKFNEKMKKGVEGVTWSDISRTIGTPINDISQLTDLSSKQLESLKTNYIKWWVELPETYRDYLESIIEKQDTLEDATQDTLEKLTGVKFDDMYSNFMSCLTDMSKGADDWASDFKDAIRKAIIENTMGDKVKKKLEDITNHYQNAMEKGYLTATERQELTDEINEASNEFYNERKERLESVGLGKSSDSSSSGGGFATASEESVEELSGRALAANEALYSIRDIQVDYRTYIEDIQTNLQGIKMSFDVSREIQENSYMELIEIRKNTGDSSRCLEQMKSELYTIRKKVENI